MSYTNEIQDLQARIAAIQNILAATAAGDLDVRLQPKYDDPFAEIEVGINILINDLTEELKEREKIQTDLEKKLATIQQQQKTIVQQQEDLLELSSPVIKIWDNVLVLPVIGTLDSRRSQIMMENLLQKIVDTGCTTAILDITGVPTIDTQVANHLIKTVTAAKLLGAECIISGISPAIAQTIVHLGIELTTIRTKASMQDAIHFALRQNNQKIIQIGAESELSPGEIT